MKILVTGSSGFIGSHLVRELEESGHEVTPWDSARTVSEDVLLFPERLHAALAAHDVCVHLAAKVGRLFGEDDLLRTIMDNAGMTTLVARACGDRGVRLVYASTSEVYGDNGEQLCHEDDGPFTLPHNLYGTSKFWGEDACALYAPDGLTVLRFSMPYGPGLPAGRGRAAIINFLYNAHHRLPIPVHRDSERSWCWIGDTVRAARLVIERTQGGAFNIGRDDDPRPMWQVAQLACDLTGADADDLIRMIDPPERQTVVKRLSTEKIRGLGWEPRVELEDGMRRTLEVVRRMPAPHKLKAAA